MATEITVFFRDDHGVRLVSLISQADKAEVLDSLTRAVHDHEAIMGDDPERAGVTIWVPWASLDHAEVRELPSS